MGKVLSVFDVGFRGKVSRSIDDIIITMKCNASADVPYGSAIFKDSSGFGIPVSNSSTFDTFVGFAVCPATKAPENYVTEASLAAGLQVQQYGSYKPGDLMEVLVRGAVVVPAMSESNVPGDAVYLRKTDGKVTGQDGSGANIGLTNCRYSKAPASGGMAEIQVLTRHIL